MYKLFVSLRLLRSHKIVYFSIAGVAIGIMILIIVTSVMGGFSRDLKARIRGIQSHIIITPRAIASNLYIANYKKLIERLKKIDGVKGCAPRVEYATWLGERGYIHGKGSTIRFMGIDPVYEKDLAEIEGYFAQGKKKQFDFFNDGSNPPSPQRFGVVAGSEVPIHSRRITLVTARPRRGGFSYCEKNVTVVGRFNTGMAEYDSSLIMMHLKDAQNFLKLSGGVVTDIAISLKDYRQVDKVRREIDMVLEEWPTPMGLPMGRIFATRTWEESKAILLKAVAIEKAIQIVILFCIIIVAGFNIVAIFTLMVKSKVKDIGILKSLGATTGGICVIFLVAGILCGTFGSVIGIAAGVGISYGLNDINDFTIEHFDLDLFPKDVYYLDRIPVYVDYDAILVIVIGTMIVSLFASIYPAIKAALYDPIETLREE